MTRIKQPQAGEKVRISQVWPAKLRTRVAKRAAKEKRSEASMTVALLERGLEKSEAKP